MATFCPLCGAMHPAAPVTDDWGDRVVMLAVRLALEGAADQLERLGWPEAAAHVRAYRADVSEAP